MAQTSALKSAAITNLDATPYVPNQSGGGAAGHLRHVDGYIATVSADNAASTYRLIRLPANAKVKALWFQAAAMTGGKFNLSAYYSDSTIDGTQVALQGLIVPSTGDQFFASDIDCASAVTKTDVTNESGNYPVTSRGKELWDALGLASNPGGFIDIVAVCHTTAVTTGAGMYLEALYVV